MQSLEKAWFRGQSRRRVTLALVGVAICAVVVLAALMVRRISRVESTLEEVKHGVLSLAKKKSEVKEVAKKHGTKKSARTGKKEKSHPLVVVGRPLPRLSEAELLREREEEERERREQEDDVPPEPEEEIVDTEQNPIARESIPGPNLERMPGTERVEDRTTQVPNQDRQPAVGRSVEEARPVPRFEIVEVSPLSPLEAKRHTAVNRHVDLLLAAARVEREIERVAGKGARAHIVVHGEVPRSDIKVAKEVRAYYDKAWPDLERLVVIYHNALSDYYRESCRVEKKYCHEINPPAPMKLPLVLERIP